MRFNRIISIVVMAVVFILLMPYGTFNPKHIGFYLCIGLALILELSIWKIIRYYQSKK